MNFLDVKGESYQADFANIVQMFKDLAETVRTDNWEGEKVTHTFSGTTNEVINHNLGVAPSLVVPIAYADAQGTTQLISTTSTTFTVAASVTGLTVTFYVEK